MGFKKSKTKEMKRLSENSSILDLPLHIMSIIISCLTIKSILCCKLVCKHWYSIINSPHFKLPSDRVTILVRRYGCWLTKNDLYLVEPEVDFDMRRFRNGFFHVSQCLGEPAVTRFDGCGFDGVPVRDLELVNSCNGLVCLASTTGKTIIHARRLQKKSPIGWGPLFVCSPVTSDYVVIKELVGTDGFCLELCGFGFSVKKSNQFKVLRLKSCLCGNGPLVAEIYALGCDEVWRSIENPPQDYKWNKDPLYFEGSLYWILSCGKGTEVTIVAFEFQEEKFSLVSPPSLSDEFPQCKKKMLLSVLNQRLSLSKWVANSSYSSHGQCDIWVMNDYGVKESWNKLFVFKPMGFLPDIESLALKPLTFLNGGELLLLAASDKLISYNVRSSKMTAVEIPGCFFIEAMLFNPNFASTRNLITPLKVEHS